MGVSTNGGQSFTDHVVYLNPNVVASYQNQFPQVSVDGAGNVYAVYSDDSNVFYSFSTDHGQTWQGPFQISKSGTNLMPWSVGGDAGKLDVVYYHTDAVTDPETAPDSAGWVVSIAQNLQATTAGASFSTSTASPTIHFGAVCQGDQSIFCGLAAPLLKVRPIPSIRPFAVLYPVPVTVSSPPLALNLNDHGPAGSIPVTAGSVDEIEASQVLTSDLVNVAETTCALPSES